ncbi:FAD-dependent monooxygenase [Streptomyces sp. Ru87]|uniref:FAD-dependent monooxygenase n=1 Tax=Streptomyces sp. Ru87 TaxID=2044307 RepID=UPI000BF5FB88|nr:FAD-dependent monooxygenase [Streptomyces sp. Ru87]PGH50253.1 pentachlorophenol monooxygenase [Streptomyces sp. Ru87]
MKLNSVKEWAGAGDGTGVLVAGAGPVGLALAVDLVRRGVPVQVIERSGTLFPGSRGKGLQPRTQEVFDDLGLLPAVLSAGGPYPRMLTWDGDRPGREWDLNEPMGPTPQAPYGGWMLPQWRTQELLYERLLELGGSVRFGTELTGLRQDADGVTVTVTGRAPSGPGGAPRTAELRTAYLVAADGGRSTVRGLLGTGMNGETVDPAPMLVADVRLTGRGPGTDRGNWHVWPQAEGGMLALCPLAGTDQFQLTARYADEDAVPDTSPDGVRRLLAARTPLRPDQVAEVTWASDFRARAALADRYRDGRVLLAGDAAHVHSPVGGQGLNTGVQDAYNLGWKLGLVLRHGAPDELLDSYETERRPIAADVLGLSTRLHRSARDGGGPERRGAETQQLGIGYRGGPLSRERRGAGDGVLCAGDRAPDAPVLAADGTPYRLFDAFRGPHFTLLAFGADAGDGTPVRPHGCTVPLRSFHVAGADEAVRVGAGAGEAVRAGGAGGGGAARWLRDAEGHAVAAYAERGLFLVRPDGYLGLATHDPADVTAYLADLCTTGRCAADLRGAEGSADAHAPAVDGAPRPA